MSPVRPMYKSYGTQNATFVHTYNEGRHRRTMQISPATCKAHVADIWDAKYKIFIHTYSKGRYRRKVQIPPAVSKAHVAELCDAKYITFINTWNEGPVDQLHVTVTDTLILALGKSLTGGITFCTSVVTATLSAIRQVLEVLLRHTPPSQVVILTD